MKKIFKAMLMTLCALVVVLCGVSCGSGKPPEAMLRADFESFLSYYGTLPFKYDFKEFSVEQENLQTKYGTCDTTVIARVETFYGDELFNDTTYTLTLSYTKNSDGKWVLHFVTIQESELHKGFDAEKVFLEHTWAYSESESFTASDELQTKSVPLSFSFSQRWETDAFSVTASIHNAQGVVDSESKIASYWGISEYQERYSARVDWDFRLTYKLASGDMLDLVHLKGSDLYSPSGWVLGYRTATNDTYNTAIYRLQND